MRGRHVLFYNPSKRRGVGVSQKRKQRKDRGIGRRTTAEQRRGKEAAIKDKRRISRKESTDISLLSSQQEADRY